MYISTMLHRCILWWQSCGYGNYVIGMHVSSVWLIKAVSNYIGCICEQIWKEQWGMKAYITINVTKWHCSIICIKLVIPIKIFLTSVMHLKWAAIFGYMYAKGRPLYSNDVVCLHQVTVPLHQETVSPFWLHHIQSKLYDTKRNIISNS